MLPMESSTLEKDGVVSFFFIFYPTFQGREGCEIWGWGEHRHEERIGEQKSSYLPALSGLRGKCVSSLS